MWKKYLTLGPSTLLASALLVFAIPASAQEMNEAEVLKAYGDAFGGVMLNNPTDVRWKTTSWNPRSKDARGKIVKAPSIRGGQAYRVKVKTAGPNHWEYAIKNPVISDIKTGDVVQIILTARASTPEKKTGVGTVEIRLQQKLEPYAGIVEDVLTLGTDWQMHYINGTATRDYKASEMDISFNIGSVKQTIEFGQFYVVNKGQGFDISKLPTKPTNIE